MRLASGYGDRFGDSIRVVEAWEITDSLGAATRVPATGNLPVLLLIGNARFAGTPGELPVIIGAAGSRRSPSPPVHDSGP